MNPLDLLSGDLEEGEMLMLLIIKVETSSASCTTPALFAPDV